MLTKSELRFLWDQTPEKERGQSFHGWAAEIKAMCKARPGAEALIRKTLQEDQKFDTFRHEVADALVKRDSFAAHYVFNKPDYEWGPLAREGMEFGKTPEEVAEKIIEVVEASLTPPEKVQ